MGSTNEQNEPHLDVPCVQFVAHNNDKSESVNLSSTMLVLVKNPDDDSSKLDVGRLRKYLFNRPGFLSSPVLREEESLTVIDVEVVDQHTLGHLFLRSVVGDVVTPRVGWQVDPFGHSAG